MTNHSTAPRPDGRYALDRIEGGLAVLQRLGAEESNHSFVTVPLRALCAHLPAGSARPADGTVFVWAEADGWRPDPAATAQRQQLVRQKLRSLLERQP